MKTKLISHPPAPRGAPCSQPHGPLRQRSGQARLQSQSAASWSVADTCGDSRRGAARRAREDEKEDIARAAQLVQCSSQGARIAQNLAPARREQNAHRQRLSFAVFRLLLGSFAHPQVRAKAHAARGQSPCKKKHGSRRLGCARDATTRNKAKGSPSGVRICPFFFGGARCCRAVASGGLVQCWVLGLDPTPPKRGGGGPLLPFRACCAGTSDLTGRRRPLVRISLQNRSCPPLCCGRGTTPAAGGR